MEVAILEGAAHTLAVGMTEDMGSCRGNDLAVLCELAE